MISLLAPAQLEDVVKKSRFIARAARADGPEAALAFLEQVREAAANHNCWAYKIGSAYRFTDDGEPGGTAGRPILGAIEGQGVDHVMVVVTRYFGGIKLGAGGLVRAYGGIAAECLRRADRVVLKPRVDVLLRAPFDGVGQIYPLLDRFHIDKRGEQFDASGLQLALTIDEDELDAFVASVRDATRGAATVRRADDGG
jgi:uncharacterized YigZ family protein